MDSYTIVVVVARYAGKYLIGKRSQSKKFAPGQWEFISGFEEPGESPHKTALRELLEETGLDGTILKSGMPYVIKDKEGKWTNVPFLVEVSHPRFRINDFDHSDLRWVSKEELGVYGDLHFQEDVKELRARGFI